MEAQGRYGINKSLYVKHDIYRFLFLSIVFFAITSFTQISSYGFKMLIIFLLTLKWHLGSLQNYNENKFVESSWNLLGIISLLSACEIFFAHYEGWLLIIYHLIQIMSQSNACKSKLNVFLLSGLLCGRSPLFGNEGLDLGKHSGLPLVERYNFVELITISDLAYHSFEKRPMFCSFTLVMMLCTNFCCLVWKNVGSLLRYLFKAWSAPTSSPLARKSNTALK